MAIFVRDQEIAHDLGTTGRFALRVTSPEVELRAVDGDQAIVRVRFELRAGSEEEADELFERVSFQVNKGDRRLEVSEPDRGSSGIGALVRLFGSGGVATDVAVTAEIPAGAEISYQGVSADVVASGFTGTQHYRTVSGDMVLDRLSGVVHVRGVSSDVTLRAHAPLRLEMNTVSGDLSAVAPRFDALRIVTVSGDVELDGELPSGPEHRIETVSGDLSLGVAGGLTLEVRGLSSETNVTVPHRSEGSRDRRRYVIGGGEGRLAFSSMSGDASIHPSRRLSSPIPPPASPAPATPATPVAAAAPAAPAAPPQPSLGDDAQLAILRALEAGEIDVDEAAARLAGEGSDA